MVFYMRALRAPGRRGRLVGCSSQRGPPEGGARSRALKTAGLKLAGRRAETFQEWRGGYGRGGRSKKCRAESRVEGMG